MSKTAAIARDLSRQAVRLDRERLRWRWAIRNATGIGVTFLIGFASHHTDWGLYGSIGAFVTGFGDIGRTLSTRLQTMLICTAAAFLSALVAALTANYDVLAITAMALWGAAFGLLMALGPVESMTGRLAALTLILIGDDPSTPERALEVATAVAAGGLIQVALAFVPTPWATSETSPVPRGQRTKKIYSSISVNDPIGRHAIRMSLALAFGVALYRFFPVGHGLWIPLTVLFVLQPDPKQTEYKVFERIFGTLLGVLLVTALVVATDPSDELMAVFATVLAVPTYAFLYPNYALFSASIAGFVVLLVSITGIPEESAALYRSVDTLIGGAIVAAIVFLIPMPKKKSASRRHERAQPRHQRRHPHPDGVAAGCADQVVGKAAGDDWQRDARARDPTGAVAARPSAPAQPRRSDAGRVACGAEETCFVGDRRAGAGRFRDRRARSRHGRASLRAA